jgi:hypothetical protein
VKLFNLGLTLMVAAVVALPILVLVASNRPNLMIYAFYFCAFLELLGLTFVLIHIITLKKN